MDVFLVYEMKVSNFWDLGGSRDPVWGVPGSSKKGSKNGDFGWFQKVPKMTPLRALYTSISAISPKSGSYSKKQVTAGHCLITAKMMVRILRIRGKTAIFWGHVFFTLFSKSSKLWKKWIFVKNCHFLHTFYKMSCLGYLGWWKQVFSWNLKKCHFWHFCHFWQKCEKVVIFYESIKLQNDKNLVSHFWKHKISLFSTFFIFFQFFKKWHFWKNVFFTIFQGVWKMKKGCQNVKKWHFMRCLCILYPFWQELTELSTGSWHFVILGQKCEKRGSKNGGSWKYLKFYFFALITRTIKLFYHFLSLFEKCEILRFYNFSNILTKISTNVWKFWKVVKNC